MTARLIDGKALSSDIRRQVVEGVAQLKAQGLPVHLAAVMVGENAAARVYAENQAKTCQQVGIDYALHTFPASISEPDLLDVIAALNCDRRVTGIFMHTPLPGHLDLQRVQYAIDVLKDVEGVNPANIGHVFYGHTIIAPCTAVAVMEMIDASGVEVRGADAVVVGASRIVGRPVTMFLTEREATVTVCNVHTRNLKYHTRRADILVVAVGKPGLIKGEDVKPGAVVVDVGINRVTITDSFGKKTEKTVGDVCFESVSEVAGHVTPVPGGVGPMTVAVLLRNTLRAARLVHGLEKAFGGA